MENHTWLPCSLRKWKYGDGKKNRVRDYYRFWLYYTQNMKKSRFSKSVCVCVSVSLSVCVSVDFFSMANDNCRKFKQNQISFCIRPWIVEVSRNFDFGEDRLRGRGSLPATFYVLTRVKYLKILFKLFETMVIVKNKIDGVFMPLLFFSVKRKCFKMFYSAILLSYRNLKES